jgi:hypothetical protein
MKKTKYCAMKITTLMLAVMLCAGLAFADTPSVTPTVTETVTETVTGTITETISETITFTQTQQESGTFTPTQTQQESETFTPTQTQRESETFTPTQTQQSSKTFTPTITFSQTITATLTMTPTVTVTLTPLPTATVIDSYYDSLALTIYPNPVKTGGNIYMLYNYSGQSTLALSLYSLDGTRAMAENYVVSGRGRITASAASLAPGVYYYIVESVHYGTTDSTKVKKLVVSR